MAALVYPISAPNTLFDEVSRSLLPAFHEGRWADAGGLRAELSTYRDPVFATVTVTLRVYPPNQGDVLTAKQSLSELLMSASSEGQVALGLAEAIRHCCALLAPRLYEYDPRKGVMVTTNRPELPVNLLFDPPAQSPLTFTLGQVCVVCGKNFLLMFGTQGHALAVWGGGNLGFLHVECCEDVGVSPRL